MAAPRSRLGLGTLVVALLVVLAVGVGTVYAAIPNSNGAYYACLVKNTGAVKLVNYPKVKTCSKGEQLITWNAKGPAGPAGSTGATGPQGPAGASGSSSWGDIANKPADLADGQIGWGEIANKPAGFADGVDNGAFVSVTTGEFGGIAAGSESGATWGPFGPNVEVDFSIVLTSDGLVEFPSKPIQVERFGSNVYYTVYLKNVGIGPIAGKIRYRVYSEGITPAALKKQLKKVKGTTVRSGRR